MCGFKGFFTDQRLENSSAQNSTPKTLAKGKSRSNRYFIEHLCPLKLFMGDRKWSLLQKGARSSSLIANVLLTHKELSVVIHQRPLPGSKSSRLFRESEDSRIFINDNSMLGTVYVLETNMHLGFRNNYYMTKVFQLFCA